MLLFRIVLIVIFIRFTINLPGSMDGFLNKVTAFVGEIPVATRGHSSHHSNSALRDSPTNKNPKNSDHGFNDAEGSFIGDDRNKGPTERCHFLWIKFSLILALMSSIKYLSLLKALFIIINHYRL